MKVLEAFNQELSGVHQDPITAIAKAGTKFSSTGLVFEYNAGAIRNAYVTGESYETPLTFAGHPLGEAPDTDPSNDFAAKEIGIVGEKGYESTLTRNKCFLYFEPVGTGYKITAELYEMKQPLNDDNIVYFAMKNYNNPSCKNIEEFQEDFNRLNM